MPDNLHNFYSSHQTRPNPCLAEVTHDHKIFQNRYSTSRHLNFPFERVILLTINSTLTRMDHIYYIPYSIKTVYREPVDIDSSKNGQYHPYDLLPRMIWIRIMSKLRIRDVLNMSEMNSSIVRFPNFRKQQSRKSRAVRGIQDKKLKTTKRTTCQRKSSLEKTLPTRFQNGFQCY